MKQNTNKKRAFAGGFLRTAATVATALALVSTSRATAQEKLWTMDDCIRYAVANSPAVRRQAIANETARVESTAATAAFFPSIAVGVQGQYNFGRAIDPETNTYVNTTTFNNYYEVGASLPVFDGGELINKWQLAKQNRQKGMNDLQKAKDDLALKTMEAFVNVVYYRGTSRFAEEKLSESNRILYKARREEELGLKGLADIAQIEAQAAADDYNLTAQQNLYTTSMLKLKELLNFPTDVELPVDTAAFDIDYLHDAASATDIFAAAQATNPTAISSAYDVKTADMQKRIERSRLFPTITLQGGVYTSYYENLKSESAPMAFNSQFKNNRGEYIALVFRYPLFDRLSQWTSYRRARNNARIAQEQHTETLRQLETAIAQAVADRDGYAKESVQMEKKLAADEMAYRVTLRKFEEGLMSPLDLRTASNALIESQANLLQRQLMYLLKRRLVDYYRGGELVDE
ncbi:MAG: TolC family protein [Tannerella sp.]|jgi:outer membrane protein|nr:TolC family protein [Tannerella sp.]